MGGLQSRFGHVRKISPQPGFDSRTVQHVASRYTEWGSGKLKTASHNYAKFFIATYFGFCETPSSANVKIHEDSSFTYFYIDWWWWWRSIIHAAVPQKVITHKIKYMCNLITKHKSNTELHDPHISPFLFKMLFLVYYWPFPSWCVCVFSCPTGMLPQPSQAKELTGGGDLREAQVDVPLSVSHSCVWPHCWAQ